MKKITISLLLMLVGMYSYSQSDTIGVYYYSGDELVKINPIKASGHKTNALGTALTMGIASAKMKVKFRGAESENKIDNPVFMFYFNSLLNHNLMMDYFNFTNPSNIKNFILVKLNKTRKGRELDWGKVNTYTGVDVGVKDENIIQLQYEQTENDSFIVHPLNQLEKGEYAFIFDGMNGSGVFMPIFDFSIK